MAMLNKLTPVALEPEVSQPPVTEEERRAFLWMQGRMVELLLRHDAPRFRQTFDTRQADPSLAQDKDWLDQYRELAVVVYLRDELFQHIVPMIKRRMSFEAPRQTQIEQLPARGRVDWSKTAGANWRERPGEVPLEVYTRQRRRHFATPENLLTVVTIMEYRDQVLRLLENETTFAGVQAYRHPLNEIVDECNRELGFLQFAGLLTQCEAILNAYTGSLTTQELEQKVQENLLPGNNSAYFDLLEWRRRLWDLKLLDRSLQPLKPASMLGANPERDNYLYQLWLFYELTDLLNQTGKLAGDSPIPEKHNPNRLQLVFGWGEGSDYREYRLQHDQSIAGHVKYWNNAPGVRPDLYIERLRPPAQSVRGAGNELIWRESGFMLDAKYYKPRPNPKAPAEPVKRMLTDLSLTGTRQGALLFAFLGLKNRELTELDEAEPGPDYTVEPTQTDPRFGSPLSIEVHKISPLAETTNQFSIHRQLTALLETVHKRLAPVPAIGCHGFFLDTASSNQDGIGRMEPALLGMSAAEATPSNGQAISANSWLVCPKPHLGSGRADIVHYEVDCLKNPLVCHIMHQQNARRPLLIPRRIEDLPRALDTLKPSAAPENEEEKQAEAAKRVEQEYVAFTRRYAEMNRVDLNQYIQQFRDTNLIDIPEDHPLLTREHLETLALGKFLWDQLDKIGANDFSGPGLHFSGVLEALMSATVFMNCPGLSGSWKYHKGQTLGTLPFIRNYRNSSALSHTAARQDWPLIEAHAARHWTATVSEEPPIKVLFDDYVKQLDSVAQLRNRAAHPGHFSRVQLLDLWHLIFVRTKFASVGMLPAILICWNS